MIRYRVTAPVLAALAALVVLLPGPAGVRPASAAPAADPPREGVTVLGRGEVSAQPDMLIAHFAVETTASAVGEALERANAAATRMRDALVRTGTARDDLQTSGVSISSTRDDDARITAYTVHQGLTATIRDLPRAGALLSAAVAAGGDAARLNGVSFGLEDDAALLAEARRKAFADARAKAALYAREAGRPLGRVVSVSEAAPGHGDPGHRDSMAAGSAVPIEPGRLRSAVTVTVEWALLPPPAQ